MRDFPQELVDKVIDNLDQLLERPAPGSGASSHKKLSDYSTVSKQWVNRTQHHHFESLCFLNCHAMGKWREAIKPDPFGVSRHVRVLRWRYIDILDGFEDHLRALTNIKEATFDACSIFCCLDPARLLSQVASNLVELTINHTGITPAILTSFLAASPHLRQFRTDKLWIELDDTPVVSPDNIPFFRGANNLTLLLEGYLPGKLNWFPSTVRFTNLGVGISHIRHDLDLVNGWIASSRETLERFDIHWELGFDDLAVFPLDLSKCTHLRTLQLPLLFNKPELFSNAISSITSPRLSTIVLYFACVSNTWVDPQRWRIWEESLCRLAQQFRTSQGEKMLVEINLTKWENTMLPPLFDNGGLLPNLGEEARIVITVDEQTSYSPGVLAISDEFGEFFNFLSDDIYWTADTLDPFPGPESTPGGSSHSPFVDDVGLDDDDWES